MTTWNVTEPQRVELDGEVGRLEVWLAKGRLNVVGTDGPPRVEVKSVGKRGLIVSLVDGVLSVRHEMRPRWQWAGPFWWFTSGWRHYSADVSIAVPVSATGRVTVISGKTVVSGLRQGATVEVTSGSITLLGLDGVVRAKTVSGSIDALGVGGDLIMETVSGEIALADSSAHRVGARTISGSITCDLDNPDASDIRLDTTSGEITCRVPADADLTVDLGATSGRIASAFPEVRVGGGAGQRTAHGRLGSGSGRLYAYAVSGHVSLLARPAAEREESR